ncbi:MAG: DUF748 domain-containing protein, partial [Proteobacteria bacterium]|nr:DUF748 domain-containing protein [Pseudomonadota bacterium]
YHGEVGLAPLSAQGQVQAVRLPLQAFAPYVDDRLNVELVRADGSFHGRVQYRDEKAGPRVQLNGDVALEDLRANSLPESAGGASGAAPAAAAAATTAAKASTTAATTTSTAAAAPAKSRALSGGDATGPVGAQLLRWKALSVRGLSVAMQPGAPVHVDVRQTALSDFFARVIINPDGRINLQNLVKPAPQAAAAAPTAAASGAGAAPTARAEPAPIINVGPISLINGKVSFTDHFIRPNYTADLSDLTGRLSAFSSVAPAGAPQMADLELRGHAEGTAALEITGKLNPLAKPLALDITGKVSDLDLPPLSPYSVKYSGHEIERGKMSMNVHYVIQPNGQLTAQNQLILNQLSFGDEVAGAKQSLPVKLAVALLADSDGVINLDIPISGSLNDPQFSLGPIIVKAIFNLIAKAITAPFSLLAHAFGGSGGEQLNTVAFAPGSATLSAEAQGGLDKVAKALLAKPKLDVTVVGTADLDAEREGYRRDRLNAMVRAEKRREMVLSGPVSAVAAPAAAASAAGSSAGVAGATPGGAPRITVSEAEYPALLKKVYRRSDIPKPRNVLGFAKDIPQNEMESLLMASIPVTDDAMRQLALARSAAVRDYLATREVPTARLFLGAPKLGAKGSGAESGTQWKPHADLSLALK